MIKKTTIALSLILAISYNSISQETDSTVVDKKTDKAIESKSTDKKRLKPVEGDFGLTFNLSGIITDLQLNGNKDMIGNEILFFKYYLKDDLALRLGLGYNSNRQKVFRKDSLAGIAEVEFDSVYSHGAVAVSFGIEKHIDHLKRLDPYFGAELGLQFISKEKTSWNEIRTESAGITTIEGERVIDGGFGMGIFGLVGFNYFITKSISLGAEYRFGYNYLKTGGNYKESEITTPPTGSVTSDFSKGRAEFRESGFIVNSTANIVFSIFF